MIYEKITITLTPEEAGELLILREKGKAGIRQNHTEVTAVYKIAEALRMHREQQAAQVANAGEDGLSPGK